MVELKNIIGVHMEAYTVKKELHHITINKNKKVSEFFHQIYPLWCIAKVPEDE
jgi:hypothetical protein